MANEIDALMQLDPLELSAQNIDDIITYHRKARAVFISGGPKPKRGQTSAPINLDSIGLGRTAEPIKRRKL